MSIGLRTQWMTRARGRIKRAKPTCLKFQLFLSTTLAAPGPSRLKALRVPVPESAQISSRVGYPIGKCEPGPSSVTTPPSHVGKIAELSAPMHP